MGLTLHAAMTASQAHQLSAYYQAARPASVIANPTILAFSIFGNFSGSVWAVDWLWRLSHEAMDDPFPPRHPMTALRAMLGGFFLALLLYIGPDAATFMAWPDIAPTTRRTFALVNRWCDFAAFIPLTASSLLWIIAQKTIREQLRREPIPIDTSSTWERLRRPLWVGFLLLCMSAALSFGR